MSGPLKGYKIVEFLGMGPAPMCARLLVDLGADILQIRRAGSDPDPADVLSQGRSYVSLNLKDADDRKRALSIVAQADALIEGYRPQVMERLGLGPDDCHGINPKLVYGRMTGWGQEGPLSLVPGHDINYIAISGALHAIGRRGEAPVPPLNLVGDFGGGALYLVMGILAALLEVKTSGQGQVVDCAMVDGVASLMTSTYGFLSNDVWQDERGVNFLDSGAPFYDTYRCADGNYIAVGAIEPQFYRCLLEKTGLGSVIQQGQWDVDHWPEMKKQFAEIFLTKSRDDWCRLLEYEEACVSPVLSMAEAPRHAHMVSRKVYMEKEGDISPGPAPRFSRSVCQRDEKDLSEWKI